MAALSKLGGARCGRRWFDPQLGGSRTRDRGPGKCQVHAHQGRDIGSYVVINIEGYDGAECEKPAARLSRHYDFRPALAIIASKVSFLEIWVVTPIGRSWAKEDFPVPAVFGSFGCLVAPPAAVAMTSCATRPRLH